MHRCYHVYIIFIYRAHGWRARYTRRTTPTSMRVQQLTPACARAYAAAGVGTGGPHILGEICTSLHSHYHSHQEYRQILVVCAHAARRYAHTRTHSLTHIHTHARARTMWKRSMHECVGHREALV
jgi:hypothetical protein